jgi:two-component system, LytTR family, sensor kinase
MASRVNNWQVVKAVVIFQVLSALLYSGQSYWLMYRGVSWWTLALYYSAINLFWAAVSPIVLWLTYRFAIERSRWIPNLAIHVLAASVLSFAALAYQALIDHYFSVFPPMVDGGLLREYRHLIVMYFQGGQHAVPQVSPGVLIYFAILGSIHAFDYYQRYRDRELQAARLREQLAQSQLQVLRAQLQPHFLFNTLNSIVGLIRNHENKAAVNMTTQLSDLLRQVLAYSDKQEAPLREEMEVTQRYLEIQQMRFSDRLKIEIHLDPETLDAKVPSLILQPLVENALVHGIAKRASNSLVALRAERRNGVLAIEVYNDGPQLPNEWKLEKCTGYGLANIRARLQQQYPAQHKFTISNKGAEGVAANLVIPFSRT